MGKLVRILAFVTAFMCLCHQEAGAVPVATAGCALSVGDGESNNSMTGTCHGPGVSWPGPPTNAIGSPISGFALGLAFSGHGPAFVSVDVQLKQSDSFGIGQAVGTASLSYYIQIDPNDLSPTSLTVPVHMSAAGRLRGQGDPSQGLGLAATTVSVQSFDHTQTVFTDGFQNQNLALAVDDQEDEVRCRV